VVAARRLVGVAGLAHWGSPATARRPGVPAVASGLLNKRVAEQLYVSAYTVEAHLSQAYAKLGIGSRTQLAAALPPG